MRGSRWWILALVASATFYALTRNSATERDSLSVGGLASGNRELDDIKVQLAEVELEIKEIMSAIQRKRLEEEALKDRLEEAEEHAQEILNGLSKAQEAYDEMLQSIEGLFR